MRKLLIAAALFAVPEAFAHRAATGMPLKAETKINWYYTKTED